jgi:predicted Zn finger-like uncharacterized protein
MEILSWLIDLIKERCDYDFMAIPIKCPKCRYTYHEHRNQSVTEGGWFMTVKCPKCTHSVIIDIKQK